MLLLSIRLLPAFLLAAPLAAQTILHQVDGATPGEGLGLRVCAPGDLDGDGVADFLAAGPDTSGATPGRVVARSGATGALLWQFAGDESGDYVGVGLAAIGDLDGDEVTEIAVGANQYGNSGPGYVCVLSGADGQALPGYAFTGAASGDRYGDAVAGNVDLDGDGTPDLVVGASRFISQSSSSNGAGYVEARSGATGALIWGPVVGPTNSAFGGRVTPIGDVNGDLVPDLLVSATQYLVSGQRVGRAYVLSGADGTTIRVHQGVLYILAFGVDSAGLDDVDGDGVPDYVIGERGWAQTIPRLVAYSGASGAVLWIRGSYAKGDYLFSMDRVPDLDGDGHADLAVGFPGTPNAPSPKVGFVELLSSASGARLQPRISLGATYDLFGYGVAHAGDLDADGVPDLVVGARGVDGAATDAGRAYVVSTTQVVLDEDMDGLVRTLEIALGTDPLLADTDADLLDDGEEVLVHATNPLLPDTDGDGMTDGAEVLAQQFGPCPDPLIADSDYDGASDGEETSLGLDPCDADFDGDGLSDGLELEVYLTDPFTADTDGDGLMDGTEVDVAQGSGCPSPLLADSDGDTLGDGIEAGLGTNPCLADTDGDGLDDAVDPQPLVPTVTEAELVEELRAVADLVLSFPLSTFQAPGPNAAGGRRTALSNQLQAAANTLADGDVDGAQHKLEKIRERLDGAPKPTDWLVAGTAETEELASRLEAALADLAQL